MLIFYLSKHFHYIFLTINLRIFKNGRLKLLNYLKGKGKTKYVVSLNKFKAGSKIKVWDAS